MDSDTVIHAFCLPEGLISCITWDNSVSFTISGAG